MPNDAPRFAPMTRAGSLWLGAHDDWPRATCRLHRPATPLRREALSCRLPRPTRRPAVRTKTMGRRKRNRLTTFWIGLGFGCLACLAGPKAALGQSIILHL